MEDGKGKFCGSCGASMPETAQFCPQCGAKAPEMSGQPVAQNDAAAQVEAAPGQSVAQSDAAAPAAAPTEAPAGAAPVAPSATPATATPGEPTATPVAATPGTPTTAPAEAPAGAPPVPPTMPGAAPYVAPVPGQTGAASSFGGAGGGVGFSGFSAQPQTIQQADLGMNWYKFLIYFALFANAVLSAITVIVLFTGSHYGGYAGLVYLLFDGLRAFDIIFGLVYLALAAMAIYVRQQLAQFKQDAPRLLCALIIANGVVSLIHLWGTALFVSFTVSDIFTTIGTIIGCAIWIAGNVVYFKKRAHLFVN